MPAPWTYEPRSAYYQRIAAQFAAQARRHAFQQVARRELGQRGYNPDIMQQSVTMFDRPVIRGSDIDSIVKRPPAVRTSGGTPSSFDNIISSVFGGPIDQPWDVLRPLKRVMDFEQRSIAQPLSRAVYEGVMGGDYETAPGFVRFGLESIFSPSTYLGGVGAGALARGTRLGAGVFRGWTPAREATSIGASIVGGTAGSAIGEAVGGQTGSVLGALAGGGLGGVTGYNVPGRGVRAGIRAARESGTSLRGLTFDELQQAIPPAERVIGKPLSGVFTTNEGRRFVELPDLGELGPSLRQSGWQPEEVTKMWQDSLAESSEGARRAAQATKAQAKELDFWEKAFALPNRRRYWYELSSETFQDDLPDLSPDMVSLFHDLIGATSQSAPPLDNLRRALSAMAHHLQGEPVETALVATPGATTPVARAFTREGLEGLKISNFAGTFDWLRGLDDLPPLSTNDRQVARMFGIQPEDLARNQALYEPISRFYLKMARRATTEGLSTEPYQSWQVQALGWTAERPGTDTVDYLESMSRIKNSLRATGLDLSEGITNKVMADPRFQAVVDGTTEQFQRAGIATIEVASNADPSAAAVRRLNPGATPQSAADLSRIQSRLMRRLTTSQPETASAKAERLTRGGRLGERPSIVEELLQVITGNPRLKVTRTAFGKGTFRTTDGSVGVHANMRIPLAEGLTFEQRRVFMATYGRALKQEAMSWSTFGRPGGLVDETPTFSVFIEGTEAVEDGAILGFREGLGGGHEINVRQVPNGTVLEINPRFEGAAKIGPDEALVNQAFNKAFPNRSGKIEPRGYVSDYFEADEYDAIIQRGVTDAVAESQPRRVPPGRRPAAGRGVDVSRESVESKISDAVAAYEQQRADWVTAEQSRQSRAATRAAAPAGAAAPGPPGRPTAAGGGADVAANTGYDPTTAAPRDLRRPLVKGREVERLLDVPPIVPKLTWWDIALNELKKVAPGIGEARTLQLEDLARAGVEARRIMLAQVDSLAARFTQLSASRVKQAFVRDAQGRIQGLPGAPTIADLAAYLPVYDQYLDDAQRQVMAQLRESMEYYTKAQLEQGIPIKSRPDVSEGGGFYLPRGDAALEDGLELVKTRGGGAGRVGLKPSSQKHAVFKTQVEGIEKGYEYAPFEDAIKAYAQSNGNQVVDQYMSNVLKEITDEQGTLLGQTAKARLLAQNEPIMLEFQGVTKRVQSLKNNLSGLTRREAEVLELLGTRDDLEDINDVIQVLQELRLRPMRTVKGRMTGPEARIALKAAVDDLSELKPRWKAALDQAARQPRARQTIPFAQLQGRAFPDEFANVWRRELSRELDKEGRVGTGLKAFNSMARGFRATGDLSWLGIQGLLGMVSDPAGYARAWKVGMRAIVDPEALGKFFDEFDQAATEVGRLTSREWAMRGLHFGAADTEYSIAARGLKVAGRTLAPESLPVVKESNRSFGFFGDAMRLTAADNMLKMNPNASARELAQAANLMTGWTRGRFLGDAGEFVQFAPRFFQSQLELAARALLDRSATGQQARLMFVKLLGFGASMTYLSNEVLGNPTDFNPTSPNFMRVRVAGSDVSLFGPWDSLLRATMRAAQGDFEYVARTKASPIVALTWDTFTGSTFIGEPTMTLDVTKTTPERVETFLKNFLPFSFQDTIRDGPAISAAFDFAGVKASPLSKADIMDELAYDAYDRGFRDLTANEVGALAQQFPDRIDARAVRKAEAVKKALEPYEAVEDQVWVKVENRPEFAGYDSLDEYVEARREELLAAGVPPGEVSRRLSQNPLLSALNSAVVKLRRRYRALHPNIDEILVDWYGFAPVTAQAAR